MHALLGQYNICKDRHIKRYKSDVKGAKIREEITHVQFT